MLHISCLVQVQNKGYVTMIYFSALKFPSNQFRNRDSKLTIFFRRSADPWPAKFSLDVKLEFNTENQLDERIPLSEYGRSHLLDAMYKVATKYTM